MPNQRRNTRFALTPPLALDVLGNVPPPVPAQLVNMSNSGTAILADVLLGDPGVILVINLPDPTRSERTPVPCELRWALAEKDTLLPRWLHGARFSVSDARSRRLIGRLIQNARRAAVGA
jgi:hypothetical protein